MTSSSKPTDTPAQVTTGSATPTRASTPTQTAAAATEADTGNTGVADTEFGDPAFSAEDLTEIENADSPFYQLASKIKQVVGERELVAALGNTERVYAMDKELAGYRRAWDDRDRDTPPEGRQTQRERQIQGGGGPAASTPAPQRPQPATSTTAAGTTATGEDTPPASTPTKTSPPSSGTASSKK
jgi:hypothetical protein